MQDVLLYQVTWFSVFQEPMMFGVIVVMNFAAVTILLPQFSRFDRWTSRLPFSLLLPSRKSIIGRVFSWLWAGSVFAFTVGVLYTMIGDANWLMTQLESGAGLTVEGEVRDLRYLRGKANEAIVFSVADEIFEVNPHLVAPGLRDPGLFRSGMNVRIVYLDSKTGRRIARAEELFP